MQVIFRAASTLIFPCSSLARPECWCCSHPAPLLYSGTNTNWWNEQRSAECSLSQELLESDVTNILIRAASLWIPLSLWTTVWSSSVVSLSVPSSRISPVVERLDIRSRSNLNWFGLDFPHVSIWLSFEILAITASNMSPVVSRSPWIRTTSSSSMFLSDFWVKHLRPCQNVFDNLKSQH